MEFHSMSVVPFLYILILSLLIQSCDIARGEYVRLAGSSSPNHGRLEVKYRGAWGAVCLSFKSATDKKLLGNAVCRQLGFPPAVTAEQIMLGTSLFPVHELPAYLEDPDCAGHERSLLECFTELPFGTATCDKFTSIAILCNGTRPTFRLAGGSSPHIGRLERLEGKTASYACGAYFYMTHAEIACRQLGFGSAVRVLKPGSHGNGTGTPWITNILCSGREEYLDECQSMVFAAGYCPDNGPAAAIECSGSPSPAVITSEDGSFPTTAVAPGRLGNGSATGSNADSPSPQSWQSDKRSVTLIVFFVMVLAMLAAALAYIFYLRRPTASGPGVAMTVLK
ncbi:scavenger receptor cysteine-rich domain-containing group B protein-like [Sycon ciliatum]|uniref:scavenger receptor cysteine-rich domain-containing group B protein-like n=1 Tax=Sycon ciliatum TaxID=27933 RepID=UPI0031F6187C